MRWCSSCQEESTFWRYSFRSKLGSRIRFCRHLANWAGRPSSCTNRHWTCQGFNRWMKNRHNCKWFSRWETTLIRASGVSMGASNHPASPWLLRSEALLSNQILVVSKTSWTPRLASTTFNWHTWTNRFRIFRILKLLVSPWVRVRCNRLTNQASSGPASTK